jgi:FKBP-type peptidyl-prolyl cis-trans isomerase SlyD
MQIQINTVVSLTYELSSSDGELIEKTETPIEYLHGGYHGIFDRVEQALQGKEAGASCDVSLEPSDAFGDYDANLMHIEPRAKFPAEIEVGMRFQSAAEGEQHSVVYTVTDITEEKVVVDGNHPLAGMALRFQCKVEAVRPATPEEIEHGHVHGAHGHHH